MAAQPRSSTTCYGPSAHRFETGTAVTSYVSKIRAIQRTRALLCTGACQASGHAPTDTDDESASQVPQPARVKWINCGVRFQEPTGSSLMAARVNAWCCFGIGAAEGGAG